MSLIFNAKLCSVYVALGCMFFTANGERQCSKSNTCSIATLKASLGSTVLLSCSFEDAPGGGNDSEKGVFWAKSPGYNLVTVTSKGQIDYQDPRDGRLKAFPNQGNLGNYSIRIDELQISDLGWYCCEWRGLCQSVEVTEVDEGTWKSYEKFLFYISGGVVLFILLLSTGCIMKGKIKRYTDIRPDYENSVFHTDASANAPPPAVTTCEENAWRGEVQQREASNGRPIYENNEHDPTIIQHQDHPNSAPITNQDGQLRNEGQRRQHVTFHRELMSRLRQASLTRHFYVNQAEISQQASCPTGNRQRASFWRKRDKEKCEYKNPIYNNSMDQLNNL